jgi:long-chain fatty acid transport protein
LILAVLGGCVFPSVVFGEAFRVLDQGAAASGQGTAFAAQADDPSALYYNPAGMTQLPGLQMSIGTLIVGGGYRYTDPAGTTYRADLDGTVAFPPPFNFYLTAGLQSLDIPVLKNVTVGVGVNTPYGLIINYPKNVPFSALDTFASLPLFAIKPTVAYKVNDWLSIGAGLDIYTFSGLAGEGGAEIQAFVPPDTNLELKLKDTAIGYNIGLLFTPWRTAGKPRLNLAFVYRSAAALNLRGDFLVNGAKAADAAVDLKLPHIYTGGIAYWPIRNARNEWKVEVDLDYVDWSRVRDLDVRLSTGVVLDEPREWKGVFVPKIGTEYRWLQVPSLPGWEIAVRMGYIYSQTPVPERYFEPAVPDANYHSVSFGMGFLCKDRGFFLGIIPCSPSQNRKGWWHPKTIGIDLAYKNQLYESRTIADNHRPIVNGTWETALHAGAINLSIGF